MSIFGSIMSKIFHHGEAAAAPAPTPTGTPSAPPSSGMASSPPPSGPASTSAGTAESTGPSPAPSSPAAPPPTAGQAAAGAPVDVAAVLDGLAAKAGQTLDWKHSIVDMMKLLDLDSSLTARKALAQELHYTGDTGDSASMNIWLHKQVMQKLADNGGKVPADLRS